MSVFISKTALLEGLEIDQYIWAILTNLNSTEFEEVTIDQAASWKPVQLKTIKEEEPGMPVLKLHFLSFFFFYV